MAHLDFDSFHARNIAIAAMLQQRDILIAGAGAIGSTVAMNLALMGANVTTADPDALSIANLPRTKADPEYLGIAKGLAVAATIRGLVPSAQRVIGLARDLLQIPQPEVWDLVQRHHAVVAATGNDDADHLLNWICLNLGVLLVVPSMWPQGGVILGDLLVVRPDHQDGTAGCFECLRPARPDSAPMLEAQEGLAAEVGMVASVISMAVVGTLLPDTDAGRDLDRLLRVGSGYRLIARNPFAVVPVRNRRRTGCRACAAVQERGAQDQPAAPRQGLRLPSAEQIRATL